MKNSTYVHLHKKLYQLLKPKIYVHIYVSPVFSCLVTYVATYVYNTVHSIVAFNF